MLKSYFACSIAFSLVCAGLTGCADDQAASELSADAGLADAAATADSSVETADDGKQLGAVDAGTEPADPEPAKAPMRDAAPSGSMSKPARAERDAGSPEADANSQTDDAGAPAPRPGASNAGAPAPTTPAAMAPVEGEIETVMMYIVYQLGVGGAVSPTPRPIILFKDGSATTDINFVVRGLDVATHKSMFPNTWTEWKIVDGKVARKNGMNWTVLDFQLKYPPNASGLTLDEAYTHLSGATVGETTAFTQQSVRFFADGKVIWGSSTGITGPDTVFGSFPPDQRGTYQIDGYTIEFRWDDGKVTKSSFVWNEQDAGALFIAGAGYVVLD